MTRRDRTAQEWDGGEWVDVGPDGRWRPSAGDRLRSIVALVVLLGALGVLAAFASVDDGSDDDVTAATTTSSTIVPTTASTTTEPIEPTSVGGEPPPEPCIFDDRGGAPLAERSAVAVHVLNGTPQGGHAGAVTDALESLGYDTVVPGNASVQSITEVRYRTGSCAEADQLRADLGIPGAEVVPVSPDEPPENRADIVVTLGRDSL